MLRPAARGLVALLIGTLAALACAATAGAAEQIAYTCSDGQSYNLCLVNPDNPSEHSQLTETTDADEQNPSWSPDGTRIAYVGFLPGELYDVFVITAGNSPVKTAIDISNTPKRNEVAYLQPPVWSPDGTRVAFESARYSDPTEANENEVLVSAADGTTDATGLAGGIASASPSWSPDGSRVAVNCCGGEVATALADGSGTTTKIGSGPYALWSPDGRYFRVLQGGFGSYKAALLTADGSEGTREIGTAENSSVMDWSADSTHLTYVDDSELGGHVVVAAVAGGPPVTIPMPSGYVVPRNPSFSPDGARVVFDASHGEGNKEQRLLLIAPADGSADATPIGPFDVEASQPDWKPGPFVGPPAPPGGGGGGGGAGGSSGSGPGTTGGSGSTGSGSSGTKTPVVVNLTFFNHPRVIGGHMLAVSIDCDAQGGHPTGKVAEICAARGKASYLQTRTESRPSIGARLARKAKSIVFAVGSVKVPSGQRKTLKLKITGAGMKLLKAAGRLRVRLTVSVKHGTAKPVTKTKSVTVEAAGK